jgi:hypothetical protein
MKNKYLGKNEMKIKFILSVYSVFSLAATRKQYHLVKLHLDMCLHILNS